MNLYNSQDYKITRFIMENIALTAILESILRDAAKRINCQCLAMQIDIKVTSLYSREVTVS